MKFLKRDAIAKNHQIISNIARDVNLVKNSNYYKIDNNTAVTRIFTGQKMVVDTRDLSLTPHIILDGEWEMTFTKIFRGLIKEDDNIIDIGSNVGWFALVGSTQNPNGKTFAIEANPELVALIQKTFEINGLNGRSKILNFALADKDGTLTLGRFENLWGSSKIIDNEESSNIEEGDCKFDKQFNVKSTTLDNICKQFDIKKLDVIKMDIEGYEQKAWKGMKEAIRSNPGIKLCLEFTPQKYQDSDNFLTELIDKFKFRYFLNSDEQFTVLNSKIDIKATISKFGFVMLILSNTEIEQN